MNYLDKFCLTGKVVVVTGGVGVLGKRFCQGFVDAGASLAIIDINADECIAYAEELAKTTKAHCLGLACDITDPISVTKAVARVVKEFGGIHVLHNNAATKSDDLDALFAPFEEYSLAQWRKVMAVNIDGMFLVAQAVGKQMLLQKSGGSIIQTASIYGILAPDQRIYEGSFYLGRQINSPAVYSASKGAVVALTKYLAAYWAKDGIRVNTITPGGVESGQNDVFKKAYSNRIPLGRMAQGDEIVGAVLFLASDASSYVTGHNLVVDGGLAAW